MFDFLSCPFCSGSPLGEDNSEGKGEMKAFREFKMLAQIKPLKADFWVNLQLIGEKKNEFDSHILSCVKTLNQRSKARPGLLLGICRTDGN